MHTETHERRAAIYARYSSNMQNPATIESQVHECQAYAGRHNIKILPDHVYADEARSGSSTLHRSALHQMLSTVRSKTCPFNVLLVWKFSRLCRSMEDSLVIRAELERAGVELVSVSEPMPQDQALGKLLRNIIGAMDDFFIERIASESRRGQLSLLRQGFAIGRCPYGYYDERVGDPSGRLDRRGELRQRLLRHISPLEARTVRRVFRLFDAGMGTPRIARMLNGERVAGPGRHAWTAAAIGRVLRNPSYGGRLVFHTTYPTTGSDGQRRRLRRPEEDWSIYPAEHLRIVDAATFQSVQRRHREFEEMAFARRHKCRKYLLSGILRCARCRRVCTTRSRVDTGTREYCCQTYHFHGKAECSNGQRLEMTLLDQRVWRHVVGWVGDRRFLSELKTQIADEWERVTSLKSERDPLQARLQRLDAEIRRLTSAIAQAPQIDPLVALLRSKASEKKAIEAQLKSASVRLALPSLSMMQLRALMVDLPRMARDASLLAPLQYVLSRAIRALTLGEDGEIWLQWVTGASVIIGAHSTKGDSSNQRGGRIVA